jgi:hypothetical protein
MPDRPTESALTTLTTPSNLDTSGQMNRTLKMKYDYTSKINCIPGALTFSKGEAGMKTKARPKSSLNKTVNL